MGKKKSDKFDPKAQIPGDVQYTKDRTQDISNRAIERGDTAYLGNEQLRGDLTLGYNNILNDRRQEDALMDFSSNGGWGDMERGRIYGRTDDLTNWAKNSISPEDMARMRGGGVYDEFSKTGGFSPGDLANYRSRGNAVTPSIFAGLKRNLSQGNAAQGGFNPGYNSQSRMLARDAARAAAETNIGVETELAGMVRGGRQWGAQGMTDSEARLQDQLSKNYLGGMNSANEAELGMMSDINRSRTAGYGALGEYNKIKLGALSGMQDLRTQNTNDLGYMGMSNDTLNTRNQGLTNSYGAYNAGKKTGFNWGGAGSGALSGAAAGSAVMPGWGTAIGAVVGGVAGGVRQ